MDPILVIFTLQLAALMVCLAYRIEFSNFKEPLQNSLILTSLAQIGKQVIRSIVQVFRFLREHKLDPAFSGNDLAKSQIEGETNSLDEESEVQHGNSMILEGKLHNELTIHSWFSRRSMLEQLVSRLNKLRETSFTANAMIGMHSFGVCRSSLASSIDFKRANLISNRFSINLIRNLVITKTLEVDSTDCHSPVGEERLRYENQYIPLHVKSLLKAKISKLNGRIHRKKRSSPLRVIYEIEEYF